MILVAPEFNPASVQDVLRVFQNHVRLFDQNIAAVVGADNTLTYEFRSLVPGNSKAIYTGPLRTVVLQAVCDLHIFLRRVGVPRPKLYEGDICWVLTSDYRRMRIVGPKEAPDGDGRYWNFQVGRYRAANGVVECNRENVVEQRQRLVVSLPIYRSSP